MLYLGFKSEDFSFNLNLVSVLCLFSLSYEYREDMELVLKGLVVAYNSVA